MLEAGDCGEKMLAGGFPWLEADWLFSCVKGRVGVLERVAARGDMRRVVRSGEERISFGAEVAARRVWDAISCGVLMCLGVAVLSF